VIESSVARRYARALFSLASEDPAKGVEAAFDQLSAVAHAFADNVALRALLQPGTPVSQQKALIDTLAPRLSPLVGNFLRLLAERQRLDGLQQIALAFGGMVDQHLGRVRAIVTAPQPLSQHDLAQVEKALAAATHKKILLETLVDDSLIGGLTADVGGVLYDGSIRTQLARLRDELKAG
jgi:F-type H+-transporting ATPase subunit delta